MALEDDKKTLAGLSAIVQVLNFVPVLGITCAAVCCATLVPSCVVPVLVSSHVVPSFADLSFCFGAIL